MPAMVTLGAKPFSGLMINSMNRMGERKVMIKGAQMGELRGSHGSMVNGCSGHKVSMEASN